MPELDCTGNRPVWSEYVLDSCFQVITVAAKPSVLSWWDCVDWTFLGSWSICPLAVAIDGLRCLVINFADKPGNEDRKPFLVALMNVVGTGLKHAAWRYCTNSALVLSIRSTALALFVLLLEKL